MSKHRPIDVDKIRKMFEYRDGKLFYKETGSELRAGTDSKGYLRYRSPSFLRSMKAHRVLYAWHFGDPGDLSIDHIDHDKANNKICNLRAVSNQENHKNMPINDRSKHGFFGVSFVERVGKWKARLDVLGKGVFLGYHDTKEEAIAARQAANIKYGYHENHGKKG